MSERARGGLVVAVDEGSPAFCAGIECGCTITHVDGEPLRDIIDWRWLSADDAIEVSYVDADGDAGLALLEREPGEDWGLSFDGAIFDGTRVCRNACTFCFMRQLPPGMRGTLSLRDDDFRLSFLDGTFVTLTNLGDEDVRRIVEQRLSPLRVSLHAVDADVRRSLIGPHAARGLENLERLLDAGIAFDAQIVLVPGENDGDVLDETLAWAYAQEGIANVGIVPLGFTGHQSAFSASFDDAAAARRVLHQVEPWQRRALAERGHPWAFAADELYRNAYGARLLDELPDAAFYGDFPMYEDGIGIVRSAVDAFREAAASGSAARCARALGAAGIRGRYVCGEAMEPHTSQLLAEAGLSEQLSVLAVENAFFGGNVNVTGLLCGCDIAAAIKADWEGSRAASRPGGTVRPEAAYFVPSIVFNADGVTLDGWTLDDIRRHVGQDVGGSVLAASVNPIDYIDEIAGFAERMTKA